MGVLVMISLKIKTPTRQFDVQVDDGAAVTVLRAAIAQELSKETNQLVLIFGGKILKDEDTLTQHAIKDGHSVHLVVKNKKEEAKEESSSANAAAPSATPTSTA